MNECEIEWNCLNFEDWDRRFEKIRCSNLLQSYDYARATCPLNSQKARWGLIKINSQEAGLIQIIEAGIFNNFFHAVMLDRGPLWFEGFNTEENIQSFFNCFNNEFPSRIGRRRRIIPELNSFEVKGYKKTQNKSYKTIWLDLSPSAEILRANLKQKWRNMLNKAEKQGLELEWSNNLDFFSWLLTKYQEDQAKKGYKGPSVKILSAMANCFAEKQNLLIGKAVYNNEAVAAILIFCHGSSATYQVGWTSDKGRKTASHNLLLWKAMLKLKEKGILDLDLGGINDDSAKNVGKFKESMGGKVIQLAGHFV
jgi:lipid II:glycine glycyltransferase (peptidoglycan interpeptide bridge formation enzyme)